MKETLLFHQKCPGTWCFAIESTSSDAAINVRLHERPHANGIYPPKPSPALMEMAATMIGEASRLRTDYIQHVIDAFVDPTNLEDAELEEINVSVEAIRNGNQTAVRNLQDRVSLLYIALERFKKSHIDVYGYVRDPWSRVWQVGNDYIEGWFSPEEFS